ncbi:MAG: hypothetical protein QOK46_758, partial [Microbacteriaceae bacterium]|nr:hypothetical protein [Microbacteriaceae bacterium]
SESGALNWDGVDTGFSADTGDSLDMTGYNKGIRSAQAYGQSWALAGEP